VIGIDLGWLFLVMGFSFSITWKRQSKVTTIAEALSGLVAGITAWLVEAQVYYGGLTLASTGSKHPTLDGTLAAIITGLVSVVVSLIKLDEVER
jgi:urea-proton symporter